MAKGQKPNQLNTKDKVETTIKTLNTMKKITLTFAIVLGMTFGALAQNKSSTLFQNPYEGDNSQSFFDYLQELFATEEDTEDALAIENEGGGMFGGGGMFQRGATRDYTPFNDRTSGLLNLPSIHGAEEDQTPLGSGVAVLITLGAAYLVNKKRKKK